MAREPGREGGPVCLQSVSVSLLKEKAQGRKDDDDAQQGECTPASEQTQLW